MKMTRKPTRIHVSRQSIRRFADLLSRVASFGRTRIDPEVEAHLAALKQRLDRVCADNATPIPAQLEFEIEKFASCWTLVGRHELISEGLATITQELADTAGRSDEALEPVLLGRLLKELIEQELDLRDPMMAASSQKMRQQRLQELDPGRARHPQDDIERS